MDLVRRIIISLKQNIQNHKSDKQPTDFINVSGVSYVNKYTFSVTEIKTLFYEQNN